MTPYSEEYKLSQLLAKHFAGTTSPEEEEELKAWEKKSEENRLLFKQIYTSLQEKQREKFIQDLDKTQAWEKVKLHLSNPRKKKTKLIVWTRIAAAITLLAGLGILFFFLNKPQSSPRLEIVKIQFGSSKAFLITSNGQEIPLTDSGISSQKTFTEGGTIIITSDGKQVEYNADKDSSTTIKENTIVVPKGGEYELVLSDKTHIWINSNSKVQFPVKFGKKRIIKLEGEAFFDVARDTTSPFIVQTAGGVEIEVLGTQFNVQAYSDENNIETTLSSGSVKVSKGTKSVELRPNQQAVYNISQNSLSSHPVEARLYTSWKDGKFIFEDATLESILTKLSRWYDVQLFYKNDNVKNYHFTGDLERYEDFTKTLRMLEKATSLHFIINGKTIIVEEVIHK